MLVLYFMEPQREFQKALLATHTHSYLCLSPPLISLHEAWKLLGFFRLNPFLIEKNKPKKKKKLTAYPLNSVHVHFVICSFLYKKSSDMWLLRSDSLLSTWTSSVRLSWQVCGNVSDAETQLSLIYLSDLLFWNSAEVWLLASGGLADSPTVPEHPSHALADGHNLGWCQLTEGLPTQYAGPSLDAGLEVGLFHQPKRHRFPHQVGNFVKLSLSTADFSSIPVWVFSSCI